MMQVVLADDRKEIVQGIIASIDWAAKDMEVHGFYNGADALAFCLEHTVDLVITDIRMPIITGLELAESLQTHRKTTRVVLLTSYEDFSYAREGLRLGAVEYLTKPVRIEAISNLLDREYEIVSERKKRQQDQAEEWQRYQRSLPALRRQWAEALPQADPFSESDLKKCLDELSVDLNPQRLLVVMVELVFGFGNPLPDTSSLDLERYAVENMGCEICAERYPCACFDLGGLRLAFILNYPREERPLAVTYHVGELFESLAERCSDILHISLAGGIGSCAPHAEELQKSWQDAQRALEQNFFNSEAQIFSVFELPDDTGRWQEQYPQALQDKTIQLLRRRDLLTARQTMDELFAQLSILSDAPPAKLRESLLSFLLRIFHECSLDQYLHISNVLEQFQEKHTLQDIQEWFGCLTDYLQDQFGDASSQVVNGVNKVKLYIDNHYAETITLKGMAALAFISPAYLSFSFKEVLGINFNEYLTNVRMEHAKELLSSRRYRVYEVCELVGYHDKKYFSDLFKKHTGVFPKEWR